MGNLTCRQLAGEEERTIYLIVTSKLCNIQSIIDDDNFIPEQGKNIIRNPNQNKHTCQYQPSPPTLLSQKNDIKRMIVKIV